MRQLINDARGRDRGKESERGGQGKRQQKGQRQMKKEQCRRGRQRGWRRRGRRASSAGDKTLLLIFVCQRVIEFICLVFVFRLATPTLDSLHYILFSFLHSLAPSTSTLFVLPPSPCLLLISAAFCCLCCLLRLVSIN